VIDVITNDGGAVCVRSDWREPMKVIRPDLRELQARRNGITRVEVLPMEFCDFLT
jgi:hypothetical protein